MNLEKDRVDFAAFVAAKPERALIGQLYTWLCELWPALPTPQAGPDGDGWELVWDNGDHHLEILLLPGGSDIEWFYRNRATDEVELVEGLKLDELIATGAGRLAAHMPAFAAD